MKFGLCLRVDEPGGDFAAHVREIEAAGFDHLWIADTVLAERDVFVFLTLAATNSTRLHIGPGVLHPFTRHFAVAVNAMESLEELAPNRTWLGIGTGGSGIGELGAKTAKVDTIRRLIALSRELMDGGAVTVDDPVMPMKNARLRFRSPDRIPIWLAATGQKMLELSGTDADGVIAHVGANGQTVRHTLRLFEQAAAERSPDLGPLDVSLWAYASISSDDDVVMKECRKGVTALVNRGGPWGELAGVNSQELAAIASATSPPEVASLVSQDTVRKLAITGTAEQCIDRIAELREAGVEQVSLVISGDSARISESVAACRDKIIPAFK